MPGPTSGQRRSLGGPQDDDDESVRSGAITSLTALDFLGLGLPPGSASLGEMVNQGRNNLHAPWLGLTSLLTLGIMLILLIFTGEAVRDALDPRKTFVARDD